MKKQFRFVFKSIIDSGFDPSDIYVFVGGYTGDYETMDVGFNVKAYKCPHNSFDFTSVCLHNRNADDQLQLVFIA